MDTREAVERAAELGMLAGQDLATARAQLVPGAHIDGAIRALVHTRITELITVFDDQMGTLIVGEFDGTYAEWERHLADKLADALAGE